MYTISKLCPDTQQFLNYLSSGERTRARLTSIAIGKALSITMSLPSAPVENIQQFYKASVLIELNTKLSCLNELAVIDFETALDYAYRFYVVRYYAAYPKRTVFCNSKDTVLQDFLGASIALDQASAELLTTSPVELSKLHNGLVLFFEEIAK